jgi:hypothetical protein
LAFLRWVFVLAISVVTFTASAQTPQKRAPLAWFPRLLNATPKQRAAVRISASGESLHWDALDEDISVAGLLAGRGDQTRSALAAAE